MIVTSFSTCQEHKAPLTKQKPENPDRPTAYLLFRQLTSPLRQINVGLLENDVGVSPTDTLNRGHGEHNLLPTIDVGVEDTQDVLKLLR